MSEKNTADSPDTPGSAIPGYVPGKTAPFDEPRRKPIVETPLDLSGTSSAKATAGDEATETGRTETTVIGTNSGTITETALDLSGGAKKRDAASATERIRQARASTAPTTREREVPTNRTASAGRKPAPGSEVSKRRGGKQTVSLAITLWLVAAVVGGIAAVFAWHPGVSSSDAENVAFVRQGETNEVMTQLASKACAPFKYKYETITDAMTQTRTTLTGPALEQFDTFAETNRKIIVQTQADGDCFVDSVGLSELRDNRAVLLAVLFVTASRSGVEVEEKEPRLQYTMEKVDGQWLIAQIDDVG